MKACLAKGYDLIRKPAVFLPPLLAAAWYIAYSLRFIQDDAFIFLRYAENWADGYGLVWAPGQSVQGFTNLLWTLWLSVPFRIGADPVPFAIWSGLFIYPLSLVLIYGQACRILGNRLHALAVLILLASNYTFVSYASGGLGTQLQLALALAAACLTFIWYDRAGWHSIAWTAGLSLAWGITLLSRLDSAVFAAVFGLWALYSVFRQGGGRSWISSRVTALILPGAVILAAYLAWSFWQYGDIMPNTFYAKSSDDWGWRLQRGLIYHVLFLLSYFYIAFVVQALLRPVELFADPKIRVCGAFILAWIVYVTLIGGGFMEFRFYVPVLPFLAILSVHIIVQSRWPLWPIVGGLILLSVLHAKTFSFDGQIRNLNRLNLLQNERAQSHGNDVVISIGKELRRIFPGSYKSGPTLAVYTAGAVPFYAKLPVVDMHGLNDRWLARYGQANKNSAAGHEKVAPVSYLEGRGVHLILGVLRSGPYEKVLDFRYCPQDFIYTIDMAEESLPNRPVILELPGGEAVALLYLKDHPAVEQALEDGNLTKHPQYGSTWPDCEGYDPYEDSPSER